MNSMFLSFLNLKVHEEPKFTLLHSQGPFELRMYPRMYWAKISATGSFDEALSMGMNHLNDYIEGNNFKVDKIERHGPIFQVFKTNHWEIGVVLPNGSVPKPINRMIKIEEISPARVGALRFKGHYSNDLFLRRGEELKKWLAHKGLNFQGSLRLTRNDPGFAVPFFTHNEVHIDIA